MVISVMIPKEVQISTSASSASSHEEEKKVAKKILPTRGGGGGQVGSIDDDISRLRCSSKGKKRYRQMVQQQQPLNPRVLETAKATVESGVGSHCPLPTSMLGFLAESSSSPFSSSIRDHHRRQDQQQQRQQQNDVGPGNSGREGKPTKREHGEGIAGSRAEPEGGETTEGEGVVKGRHYHHQEPSRSRSVLDEIDVSVSPVRYDDDLHHSKRHATTSLSTSLSKRGGGGKKEQSYRGNVTMSSSSSSSTLSHHHQQHRSQKKQHGFVHDHHENRGLKATFDYTHVNRRMLAITMWEAMGRNTYVPGMGLRTTHRVLLDEIVEGGNERCGEYYPSCSSFLATTVTHSSSADNNEKYRAEGEEEGSIISQQPLFDKAWNDRDPQCYQALIQRLRKKRVKLFSYMNKGTKSIQCASDLLNDEGWTEEECYHRFVTLRDNDPWSLTLKQTMCPTVIDLSDENIGDEIGRLLAESLIEYPLLQRLDISKCNLTDQSLIPTLKAVMALDRLEVLNLGGNDIDDSSRLLRSYLESPACRLISLGLNHADLDDYECGRVMDSMTQNTSILTLDLAHNLIGESVDDAGLVNSKNSSSDSTMSAKGEGGEGRQAPTSSMNRSSGRTKPAIKGESDEEEGQSSASVRRLSQGGGVVVPTSSSSLRRGSVTLSAAAGGLNGNAVIGAKSISVMLRHNSTLVELDLSNNFLRGSSALVLADALRENAGLTKLNVANNGFHDEASQQVAAALRTNHRLKYLDMSFNGMSGRAAIVFADALGLHNHTLEKLILNGNPLGARAIRALFRSIRLVVTKHKHPVLIEMLDCNRDKEDLELYDVLDPTGSYTLQLTGAHDYAVAHQLFHAACSSIGCQIKSLVLVMEDKREGVVELKKRGLVQGMTVGADPRIGAERLLQMHRQRGIIYPEELGVFMKRMGLAPSRDVVWRISTLIPASDLTEAKLLKSIFVGVFREVDDDQSGQIDLQEFIHATKMLGLELSEEVARQHLVEYDIDRKGCIEEAEFIMYMTERFSLRPHEFQEIVLINTMTGLPWTIPETGAMKLEVINEVYPSTFNQAASELAVHAILENLKLSSRTAWDRAELFELATLHSDLYLNSTQVLYLLRNLDIGAEKMALVAAILPQIVNYKAALEITETFLNLRQRFQLRKMMGNAFRAIMGIPTGHYVVNLENKWDRIAMRKLAELNNRNRRDANERGQDTSQRGQGHSFRNESLDGFPLQITSDWILRSMPQTGILRFDYVSTIRPQADSIPPLTTRRFRQLLHRMGLVGPTLEADLTLPAYRTVAGKNMGVFDADSLMKTFMTTTSNPLDSQAPPQQPQRQQPPQQPEVHEHLQQQQTLHEDLAFRELLYEDPLSSLAEVLGPWGFVVEDYRELKATTRAAAISRAERQKSNDPLYELPIDDSPKDSKEVPATKAKVYVRLLLQLCELELAITSIWITCIQVTWVLCHIPKDDYLRVRAILITYSKILDLENLHLILDMLEPWEKEEVIHRLGNLNVYDGTRPISRMTFHNLHLDVYEDRQICKILVLLAMANGIETWSNLRYRSDRDGVPLRHWKLPKAWIPEFLPTPEAVSVSQQQQQQIANRRQSLTLLQGINNVPKGFLTVTYSSTPAVERTAALIEAGGAGGTGEEGQVLRPVRTIADAWRRSSLTMAAQKRRSMESVTSLLTFEFENGFHETFLSTIQSLHILNLQELIGGLTLVGLLSHRAVKSSKPAPSSSSSSTANTSTTTAQLGGTEGGGTMMATLRRQPNQHQGSSSTIRPSLRRSSTPEIMTASISQLLQPMKTRRLKQAEGGRVIDLPMMARRRVGGEMGHADTLDGSNAAVLALGGEGDRDAAKTWRRS